jgi:hypothetical protein
MKINMEYSPPKFSDKELLVMFPEAEDIILPKIKDFQKLSKQQEKTIKELLNKIYLLEADSFSEWFAEELIKMLFLPKLNECNRHIARLNRLLSLLKSNNNAVINFQADIERARNYPIYELARGKLELRQIGKNHISLCPFHNEKHASFYLYTETNTFHCFGCQENGDVIKLTMALHGINFKEAIAILQN